MWVLPEAIAAAEEALTLLPVDSVEHTSAAATGLAAAVFGNIEMSARLQAAIPKLLEILPTLAPSERTGFQRFGVDSALWSTGLVDAAIDQCMRHRARSTVAIAESEAYRHWGDICEWYPVHVLDPRLRRASPPGLVGAGRA